MGQFSWIDCKSGKQILDDVRKNVYVLVPNAFGGGHIEEECYDGYGDFGGHDIYNLVAEWNRGFATLEGCGSREWAEWRFNGADRAEKCFEDFNARTDDDTMRERYGGDYKRTIGIILACNDEDNANLRYPIKITYDKYAVYEWCAPSRTDPNQGWA